MTQTNPHLEIYTGETTIFYITRKEGTLRNSKSEKKKNFTH